MGFWFEILSLSSILEHFLLPGQNIQVFARCRPLNQAEKNVKAYSIVDIPSHREIVIKEKPNTNLTKSYQFDKVFGPKSQQLDVYRAVVEPLIEQVIILVFELSAMPFKVLFLANGPCLYSTFVYSSRNSKLKEIMA